MIVVWDEPKRLANLEKHGLDFADFERQFSWSAMKILETQPSRTGRRRLKFLGTMGETAVIVAIVSPLGEEALSVVSLRRASPAERSIHEQT